MTGPEERDDQLRRGEEWLREQLAEEAPPDPELMKLRMSIAADEAWLAERLEDAVPGGLAERIKLRVAGEVESSKLNRGRGAIAGRYWLMGTGAIAAALAFAVFLNQPSPETGEPVSLIDVLVESEGETTENAFDGSLDELYEEVDRLGLAWGEPVAAEADDESYEAFVDAAVDMLIELGSDT